MIRNATTVGAPAETAFSVLADPRAYDDLLPGARRVRGFDQDWPRPGSAVHQTLGIGPLGVPEEIEVVEIDEPGLVRLRVRLLPLCVRRLRHMVERRRQPQSG